MVTFFYILLFLIELFLLGGAILHSDFTPTHYRRIKSLKRLLWVTRIIYFFLMSILFLYSLYREKFIESFPEYEPLILLMFFILFFFNPAIAFICLLINKIKGKKRKRKENL